MFLLKVDQTFLITDLGLVLTPGLGENVNHVSTGTKIRLIRPDKPELETTIKGIAFDKNHSIVISEDFAKEDVPTGTEVWINEQEEITTK